MDNLEVSRNNELIKYAKGGHKREFIQIVGLWLLGSIGLWIVCAVSFMAPSKLDIYQNLGISSIIVLTVIKWCVAVHQINKIEDKITEPIYHLIRMDERNELIFNARKESK